MKTKSLKAIRKENKNKRNVGQSYTNEKGLRVPSKSMGVNSCQNVICKRSCGDIPDSRRHELFTYYWNISSYQRQKGYIYEYTKKHVSVHITDK